MDVLGHHHKGVELESAFAAVAIQSLQEKMHEVLDDEQSSALPCRERHKICSGRRDESSRLQEQTSAAEAAIFA